MSDLHDLAIGTAIVQQPVYLGTWTTNRDTWHMFKTYVDQKHASKNIIIFSIVDYVKEITIVCLNAFT